MALTLTHKDTTELYYFYSGKASDLSRQLALAGLAIIWIFKVDHGPGTFKVPPALLWPGAFVVLSLILDIMQYAYATAAWGLFGRHMEKALAPDATFEAPATINWPSIALFWAKLVAVSVGYVFLFRFLLSQLI